MKTLLTCIFIITSILCFAQENKKEQPKHLYKKVVQISVDDLKSFHDVLEQFRRLTIYDPTLTPSQMVTTIKSVDTYLIALSKRIKIDSVRIDTAKAMVPKRK